MQLCRGRSRLDSSEGISLSVTFNSIEDLLKMKYIFASLFAALIAFSGAASAQLVIGVVGWSQGGGATSGSNVSGAGGSGAAIAGISGTQTTAASSNLSAAQTTQTPGVSTTVTESISSGGMQSTSGALGLAGAGSGSSFSAGGFAGGGGGQSGGAFFIAP